MAPRSFPEFNRPGKEFRTKHTQRGSLADIVKVKNSHSWGLLLVLPFMITQCGIEDVFSRESLGISCNLLLLSPENTVFYRRVFMRCPSTPKVKVG